jgi:hypothetical protein
MVAHEFPRPSLTRPSQPNSAMFLKENQRRPVSSELLNQFSESEPHSVNPP